MTKEEIEQLPAGRELDALIAEALMGWSQKDDSNGFQVYTPDRCLGWWRADQPKLGDRQPCFSTDIAAAWQVVEKINKTHYLNTAQYWIEGGSNGGVLGFIVAFRQYKTYKGEPAKADTMPLAICRAALLTTLCP